MAEVSFRSLEPGEHEQCEAILRALPEWFGIEQSLLEYVRDSRLHETEVVVRDGRIVAFQTLKRHGAEAAEIHCLAVRPEQHGQGMGRQLVERAEQRLRSDGVSYLQVKTLGPSRPDEHYAKTRAFYEHLGFVALEEHDLWGARNPCQVYVKHLGCGPGGLGASRTGC